MRIDHLAIWCKDIEAMRRFYTTYFGCVSNQKYHNPKKQFSSYFLSFSDGCRIELMHRPDIAEMLQSKNDTFGIAHFAINVGSEENVNALTERLRNDGVAIAGEPRRT
ncbi:MAG: VOC family protein [Paludibacteraceae bacterium]|nr:VOC family protein [Paludibacteraceae bacterium]